MEESLMLSTLSTPKYHYQVETKIITSPVKVLQFMALLKAGWKNMQLNKLGRKTFKQQNFWPQAKECRATFCSAPGTKVGIFVSSGFSPRAFEKSGQNRKIHAINSLCFICDTSESEGNSETIAEQVQAKDLQRYCFPAQLKWQLRHPSDLMLCSCWKTWITSKR